VGFGPVGGPPLDPVEDPPHAIRNNASSAIVGLRIRFVTLLIIRMWIRTAHGDT
jgi:hypothetical protein